MNRNESLEYCAKLARQILKELDTMPAELSTAIEKCHPTNPLWAYELRELVSELYLMLPEPEPSHMQQAYAARLEEHQRFIENERGEQR